MNPNKIGLRMCLVLAFMLPVNLHAWDDGVVHPILSEAAVLNSTLNTPYIIENIGLKDGKDEVINGTTLIRWIRMGSTNEDKFPRFINHFHNPLHTMDSWDAAGLNDFLFSGRSALLWAQDSGAQEGASGGDWSWSTIRGYYHDYLTALDRTAKDAAFVKALLGLGHQMHLLQDMAVPAHVRNDAHPLPFNAIGKPHLEMWAAKREDIIKNIATASLVTPAVDLNQFTFSNSMVLAPMARLSDSDQYDGTNPSAALSVGLAEYTNANFFSDDTIFTEAAYGSHRHGFPFPRAAGTDLQAYIDADKLPVTVIARDGIEDLGFWIEKTGEGEEIAHFVKPTYFTRDISAHEYPALYYRLFYLDEACHLAYAEKLVPRAVGYSAALIDYFFRGTLDVRAMPYFYDSSLYALRLKIENTTPTGEALSNGTFSLVFRYTPTGGNPDGSDDIFIPAEQNAFCHLLPYQTTMEAVFSASLPIPVDYWNSVTATLVFQGTLGQEPGAVVGRVFHPGEILFSEDWDQGITGTHNWYSASESNNPANGWSTKTCADGRLIMQNFRSASYDTVRYNDLQLNLTADGSDGLLITPTTHLQFYIPEMITATTDEREFTHALMLVFKGGWVIQYTGDDHLSYWSNKTVYLHFNKDRINVDNIRARFQSAGFYVPDPLYLQYIILLQQVYESEGQYHFYMDVDGFRLIDTEW